MARGDGARRRCGNRAVFRDLRSVYYARPGWDALEQVSAETSASGVQQTIDGLPGFRHVVSDRVVFVRSEREVAVSFRKSIENDERQYIALMLQVWCRSEDDDAKWLLVRETVEK